MCLYVRVCVCVCVSSVLVVAVDVGFVVSSSVVYSLLLVIFLKEPNFEKLILASRSRLAAVCCIQKMRRSELVGYMSGKQMFFFILMSMVSDDDN